MKKTVAFAVLALVATACAGENHYEALATQVTKAIVANDMRPVVNDFNPVDWRELGNRALVGRLSNELNDLGPLQSIKEDTPSGSDPLFHHFQAHFSKATWVEDMTMDPTGKIVSFHVRAPLVTPQ